MVEDCPDTGLAIPLEYRFPPDVISRYATNILVQNTASEFVLSFFEVRPPVLLGTPEENVERIKTLGPVPADCVARLVIAPSRMGSFIDAMQRIYEQYKSREKERAE